MSKIPFTKTNTMTGIHSDAESAPQTKTAESAGRKIVIAIDGPGASGKGTLAKMIAERLGYAYLDTGALYRAVGLATLEINGDFESFEDVEPAVQIVLRHLTPELLANPALRAPEITEAASRVATLPDVRHQLTDIQRAFAKNPPGNVGGAVLDGRDIGTVICPDADLKIFVTASAEERARRSFEENKKRYPHLTLQTVLQDMQKRDQRDSSRPVAPMVAAQGAYILDTTHLTPAEMLEEAIAALRSKFLEDTNKPQDSFTA